MGGKGDSVGIVQKIKSWPCWQTRYTPTWICLKNEKDKILWDFETQMDHSISARNPDWVDNFGEKRISQLVDFAIPENYRVKNEKNKRMKRQRNTWIISERWKSGLKMKVTLVLIVVCAQRMVQKGLEKRLVKLEIKKLRPYRS